MSSGRFDFGADQRKRIVPACILRTRIVAGELFAEIIEDRWCRPPIVHCVVQRLGSPEILVLQQFHSHREAELAAKEFISDYLSRQQRSNRRAA